jgi:hypothetical protein
MKKVLAFPGLSGSPGWSLVVETVALGSASIICLPLSSSHLDSEPEYDSKAFTSATSNCFERQSVVLCQGLLWKSPLPGIFLFLSGVLLCLRPGLVVLRQSSFALSFVLQVRDALSWIFL